MIIMIGMSEKTNLPQNLWKSPVIKARLDMEAAFECRHGISDKKHYWVLVPESDTRNGVVILKNFEPNLQDVEPHEMQQEFARQVQQMLQKEASFDGLWLVGYTHPPSSYGVLTDTENCWNRLIAIWHDQDGDPQYTLESDLPFINQLQAGEMYYVELAHQSHKQWEKIYGRKAMKSDMLLEEGQTTKAALEALN